MNYFVKRDDKEYGPYTLAALQQYVSQGNISQQDLARSEAMADWVPVASILGNVSAAPPAAFGAGAVTFAEERPLPPGLHWGLVVFLGIITLGLFWAIWLIVQAVWIRKVWPPSQALFFILGYIGCSFAAGAYARSSIAIFLQLAGLVLFLVGIFKMRSDIEDYYATINPTGLSLSGVMTFFFNAAYFQYHFREIREASQTANLSMAARA